MRRRDWVGLGIVALELALAAGCGVDSYLTCGAPCEDSGAQDATVNPDSGGKDGGYQQDSSYPKDSSYPQDSGSDAFQQKDSGSDGNCTGNYCQGQSSCCGAAPVCNASNHCAATCGAVDASCTTQGGDTCCKQSFCSGGVCSQCFPKEAGCTNDNQCCGGNCSNTNTCQ